MTDYDDYNENLAFAPDGDWAETKPVQNTDRTESTIELVEKIEKLSKQLNIAKEYLNERAGKDKYADWVLLKIKELDK